MKIVDKTKDKKEASEVAKVLHGVVREVVGG